MLSWALKRNSDSARDAPGQDDTQTEIPDTPAPVFAVRALKTALFGTPVPRAHDRSEQTRVAVNNKAAAATDRSPVKPPGILLTPGTATARRKRVSFGHGVKEGAAVQPPTSTSGLPDECPGKFPSPWVGGRNDEGQPRPKTKLTEALENSRTNKARQTKEDAKTLGEAPKEMDAAWEETDDESDRDPDVTVDLNEPHSRSGKYWKSYFEEYHADAKAEMEKLVKYKQLAKSYAKKKDSEALDLNEKLKEEQERVKMMEGKVAELSRQVALTKKRGGTESETGLMVDELAKQTALAFDYRKQVEELESLLQDGGDTADMEDKGPKQRRIASPRTHKTLLEAQKELRKARSQCRELDKIREERDRLRSELKFAEQRATKLVEENKKITTELSQANLKIQDLDKKAVEFRGEAFLKDRELKKLRADYEKLKDDAKARYAEARQVLEKKNNAISELQDEILSLTTKGATLDTTRQASLEKGLVVGSTRPRLRSSAESYKRNSYDDETLASSRALREKLEVEMGKRNPPVLGDRANLQDSRSSASSGVSQVSAYTKPTSSLAAGRAERASWTATSTRNSTAKRFPEDTLTEDFTSKTYTKQVDYHQVTKPSARSRTPDIEPPKVDLFEDTFAPLGGPETHNSTVWTADVSRTKRMTDDRRAAAKARLALKKAMKEREQHQQEEERRQLQQQQRRQPDRNKENMQPVGLA